MDADREFLQQQLTAAHAEEMDALQEAVRLLQSNAHGSAVQESYRRCERARAEKNRILRLLGKLGPRPSP